MNSDLFLLDVCGYAKSGVSFGRVFACIGDDLCFDCIMAPFFDDILRHDSV